MLQNDKTFLLIGRLHLESELSSNQYDPDLKLTETKVPGRSLMLTAGAS